MKKNILNLKEEILRIKSLFTEERMFGNLVEDDPGCQCDDPKKEKYGKYNPETSECDPKLCEEDNEQTDDSDEQTDVNKNKSTTNQIPEGFIELTNEKKNQIENDESDSLSFYEQKVINGKTYVKRKKFDAIKIMLGSVDRPKPGRDMDYVKKSIKDDSGKLVELYITKDADLQFLSKKEGKGIKKDIKGDVKQDKKVIDDNIDSCKEHIKAMYRAWKKGAGPGDLDTFGFEDSAYYSVERCMANFYNRFEKNEDLMVMINHFKDENLIGDYRSGEKSVSKGVEGEKYVVKNDRGTKLGVIKKITGNEYKFNGVKGMTFFQKKNGRYIFRNNILTQIYKTLNLDANTNTITIMTGDNNGNDCTFRVK